MKALIYVLTSILTFPALANWQLNSDISNVGFTTFKKEHVAENHQFDRIKATIDSQGKVELLIDLGSVNTNIAVRDERMKEHLFNVGRFSQAAFTSQLAMDKLLKIKIANSEQIILTGFINLHGHSQEVSTEVLVTRLNEKNLLVTSIQPLLIKASEFGLVKGINKLQKLANLPSISNTVPVSFILNFTTH